MGSNKFIYSTVGLIGVSTMAVVYYGSASLAWHQAAPVVKQYANDQDCNFFALSDEGTRNIRKAFDEAGEQKQIKIDINGRNGSAVTCVYDVPRARY